jgi:hypothetical protein
VNEWIKVIPQARDYRIQLHCDLFSDLLATERLQIILLRRNLKMRIQFLVAAILVCLIAQSSGFRANIFRSRRFSSACEAAKVDELNKARSGIMQKGLQGDAWIGLFNEKEKGFPVPVVVPVPASLSGGVKSPSKPSGAAASAKSDGSYDITAIVDGAEKKLKVKAGELLLDALENAGIDQVSSCRAGKLFHILSGDCF